MSEELQQVEQEARMMGWVDKDEFRGNENDWVDADSFVKRGREINPILRKNNEKLLQELTKTRAEIEEIRKSAEEFKAFQKEAFERKIQEYKKEVDTLKEAKKDALREGDHDLVVEIDDRISETRDKIKAAEVEPPKEKETPPQQALDPDLKEWMDRNSWFGQDVEMSQRTNALGSLLATRNPGLKGKAFLEKLDEALKEEFPERFGSKRERPNPVEGGGTGPRSTAKAGKRSYENLPADAKAACDKFVRQKLMTAEEYVAMYDWE